MSSSTKSKKAAKPKGSKNSKTSITIDLIDQDQLSSDRVSLDEALQILKPSQSSVETTNVTDGDRVYVVSDLHAPTTEPTLAGKVIEKEVDPEQPHQVSPTNDEPLSSSQLQLIDSLEKKQPCGSRSCSLEETANAQDQFDSQVDNKEEISPQEDGKQTSIDDDETFTSSQLQKICLIEQEKEQELRQAYKSKLKLIKRAR